MYRNFTPAFLNRQDDSAEFQNIARPLTPSELDEERRFFLESRAKSAENGSGPSAIGFWNSNDADIPVSKPDTWHHLSLTDAFCGMQSGKFILLFHYLCLRLLGIEGGQEFTLSAIGWHGDRAAHLRRFCNSRRGPHGAWLYRMPHQHTMSRLLRGGHYDGGESVKYKIRKPKTSGVLLLSPDDLSSYKAFRRRILLEYLKANAGKHFMQKLSDIFGVSRSTIRRDIADLPIDVRGNWIELTITDRDQWRRLRMNGADWYRIEARIDGEVVARRLLRSVADGFFNHYHQSGYQIVCMIRTANSYYLRE